MKIALCLSGQPRNAIQISERVKQTIINDKALNSSNLLKEDILKFLKTIQ